MTAFQEELWKLRNLIGSWDKLGKTVQSIPTACFIPFVIACFAL